MRLNCSATTRGFTLIELLIALTLGLILVAGTVVVFVQSRRSAMQDAEIARVLQNGRFTVRLIMRELSMAGLWGNVTDGNAVSHHESLAVRRACNGDQSADWVFALPAVAFLNNANSTDVAASYDCLPHADIVSGADILVSKRVAGTTTTASDLQAGRIYVRSNGVSAQLFLASGEAAEPVMEGDTTNRAYIAQILYLRDYSVVVGDGIPTLCRAYLNTGTPPDMRNECLVEGVENLQLQFGIDTDGDAVANFYHAAPDAAQLSNAVTVRVHLLLRSINSLPGHVDNAIYTLGKERMPAASDGHFRRVFTSTVLLRNRRNAIWRGG